tara:strand:+ start:5944 stop:7596 length:1653 start_codon:yes stop_codon:yes gene_type:complete
MENSKIIFSMNNVSKVLSNGKYLVKDINLSFFYGAKIGIIGENGSGKSTLLNIISGNDQNYIGDIISDKEFSVGILEQDPKLDINKTVFETIKEANHKIISMLDEFDKISQKFTDPNILDDPIKFQKLIDRQGELQDEIDTAGGWEIDNKIDKAMSSLRTPPGDSLIKNLSGGERKRVALCKLILQSPDVLLLDEPTNHLDTESVNWLEKYLEYYKGTVITITHDRYFLNNVSKWILELDKGIGVPWKGNYHSWLDQKISQIKFDKHKISKKLNNLINELEWFNSSSELKLQINKNRLNNYEKLLKQNSIISDNLELYIPPGPRLGNNVLQFKSVTKKYNKNTIIDNLSFNLPQSGITGIIGPNGCGKTTLFKLILELEFPNSGEILKGKTVKTSYFDQLYQNINKNTSVWDIISGGNEFLNLSGKKINSRSYISKFKFSGQDQGKNIRVLSGGEKNRLNLALTFLSEGNLLLLDEPTNDLDINTLRILEQALINYVGCALVISHDRMFLDRICTHILSFEGNSKARFFEGSYSEYMQNKHLRLSSDSSK